MTDADVEVHNDKTNGDHEDEEHDPYFEPVITLPEVHIYSMEEDEEDLVKLRGKLFRYDKTEEPHSWKERGTGEIKILCHLKQNTARVLMRRDKTWKICANHYINQSMQLKPNCGSDRAWMWSVPADFADETPKPELLAVRFANAENANKFKEAFEEAQHILEQNQNSDEEKDDGVGSEDDTESNSEESEDEREDSKAADAEQNKVDAAIIDKLEELKVSDQVPSTNKEEK